METQSGARTPLVDPFGRELEEWLRDAPATRTPYVADLVVPPVTGPVQRPDLAPATPVEDRRRTPAHSAPASAERGAHAGAGRGAHAGAERGADAGATPTSEAPVPEATAATSSAGLSAATTATPAPAPAFRRDRVRDHARHAASCAPSFPEPPERIALRIEDLAVEVASSTGRSAVERIVLLEDEVRRRDEDLARLAAWEATVAGTDDPEVRAARDFARTVFADLLADAALEADRRDRAAARRAATTPVPLVVVPAPGPTGRSTPGLRADVATARPAVELVLPERDEPVRPVAGLPAVSPVSANTRPTPLVQPATGPTVIDRAAFAAALTAHQGRTASTPVVLPDAVVPAGPVVHEPAPQQAEAERPGWWSRLVARLLHLLGR
ncbi:MULTISPECIES: hypothetical protein [unclassified Curtobacterium]|uniref:hypothetical protein n=1 Tax=unclassified Curtobacterium TaxID=257496 RepID=UPI0008DD0939|nr:MULTISPECIES: hypothetical protein [unclassified Curtobacterium]OIH95045.1 hypothetical protein BIU92_06750 [Curtobacterium sp. MCBA15_003]OII12849.1 hypothetical protein BIU97_02610 [Curtobacterium sp. MCBA15_009]OII32206.1 hypothetical protein BIU94_02295 [Curtobacterium sp. MMLR14_006]